MESVVQGPPPVYTSEQLNSLAPTVIAGTGTGDVATPQLDREFTKSLLRRQVEYYFSRDNLNHDTYLVSQMDADQYVDISIIARFNQVKRLTDEIDLLVEVLKESPCVQVDESERKVRPLHKRCMVIIREVPEDTTQQEIENMLKHSDCPAVMSCEYASGNCWYIEFGTEEHAKIAFDYLRAQTFKGQPLKVRIKSKPSAASSNNGRPEPARTDIPISNVADPMRAQAAVPLQTANTSAAIRYPVPLQHIPLQAPATPYPYTMSTGHQIQYLPYIVPQLFQQPPGWSYAGEQPAYAYEVNTNYGYAQPAMPNQPRPSSQPSGPSSRDWKSHNRNDRANGNISERNSESNRGVTNQNSNSTSAAPKNTSTGYYNGRGNSESSSHYNKHNGSANRNRSYVDNQSNHDRNYDKIHDNMPPRFRRSNKDKRISGQHNYSPSQQSSQIPPAGQYTRRSVNSHQHRGNPSSTPNGTNNTNHLPHNRGAPGPSPPSTHSDRGSKEYPNKQLSSDLPSHAHRSHVAHRSSRSPEKDVDQTSVNDITKSQSFELDSSAFPALPGATTATSLVAATTISSDVNLATVTAASVGATATTTTTVSDAINQEPKQTVSIGIAADVEKPTGKNECGGVSKLSDIVKNNIHELSKIADASKGTKSGYNSSTYNKESTDKSTHAIASKVHAAGNKSQSTSSHQKGRPTHLTNGVHSDSSANKSLAHGKSAGRPAPSKAHADNVPAQPNKDTLSEQTVTDSKIAAALQVSPSDSKISYADVAKTTAAPPCAPNKLSPTQDTSPISPTACSSSGDNNNNAECKSTANSSRADNLQYSTAAKSTPNTATGTNSPRKAAAPQQQHSRNGSVKPKNGDGGKPAPTSPPSRNPPSSHSTVVSSTLAAR